MRTLITWLSFLISGVAIAAPVSRVTNFVDGNVLTASQLNSEFNNVISGVNSITDAQIASGAAIAPSKISAVIKGTSIARDGTTGALSVKTDNVGIESSGDNLQLKDVGVTAAKLATNSVQTAKIVDLAVTTAKIADGAVTQAKRAALNIQTSSGSGTGYSNATATPTDVTNLSVTITTTGRPVFIGMIGDGSSSSAVQLSSTGGILTGSLFILEASTQISDNILNATYASSSAPAVNKRHPCSSFNIIYTPAAGTYTYKVQANGGVNFNTTTISVDNCKLVAYEL